MDETELQCVAAVRHTAPSGTRAVKMTLVAGVERLSYFYVPTYTGFQAVLAKRLDLPDADGDLSSLVGRKFKGSVRRDLKYPVVTLVCASP